MKNIQFIDSNMFTPKDSWDLLSMAEKSEMMKVAVRNGITKLQDIRDKYNEFAEGGNIYAGGSYMPSEGIKKRISTWEGTAMTGAKDPLSGKFLKNNSFESEAVAFTQALPESIREQVLSNPELADNLFSYSYNVGAPNFKKRVVKALEDYYAGKGTAKNIADSMWASGDAKLRGLRNRRAEEKEGVMNALRVDVSAVQEPLLPVSTSVVNPFILPAENTTFLPQVTPVEDNYVEIQEITPEQRRAEQVRNTFDAINSYNKMMDMLSVPNNPAPVYRPKNAPYVVMGLGGPIVEAAMNEYKKGGGIHIKHPGRLTALKKRTGKTEAELYNDGNPAHKKMVVFARSARKWKHALGGPLQEDDDYPDGYWENRREHPEVRPQYKRTKKDDEYWEEKNRRNAQAAEELNRRKGVVMSALSDTANSVPVTGSEITEAAEAQKQEKLDKAHELKMGLDATMTAAELLAAGYGVTRGLTHLNRYMARQATQSTGQAISRDAMSNLAKWNRRVATIDKPQVLMNGIGGTADAYQWYTANNNFDAWENGLETGTNAAGVIGGMNWFRDLPYLRRIGGDKIDTVLDGLGYGAAGWDVVKNIPPLSWALDNIRTQSKENKALGGNLFSGEEEGSQQMQLGRNYWKNQDAYPEWGSNATVEGGTLPEIVVTPTNDAAWLFSIGKYQHNSRKPLADKHTRKVISNYLSKFDNESAEDYNARISRLSDVLDIRGVQFKKNDVKSGKLKGRAHYIDNSATAYIDNVGDIFAEVAHPWQYAKGNNNIEEEVGVGTYDSDSDPRGGTRYAYPDTAEGETHSFFEPTLTEWIETGKISKSSPILNEQLSKQKIIPKDRMEVADSAASWNKQAIDKRIISMPSQLPLLDRIKYTFFDFPLLDKPTKALGGNLYDGTSQPTQKMNIGLDVQGWPDYTTEQIVAYGKENERRRKAIQDAYLNFVTESNDATAVANGRPQNKHLEERGIKGAKAHAAWEKEHPVATQWGNVLGAVPFAVAAYPLAATAGSGIAALGDAAAATSAGQAITAGLAPLATAASTSVAGAPLYTWADVGLSSLFGGHGVQTAIEERGVSPMTALEVAPLGRLAKPIAKETALAIENYRYPLGRPQVPEGFGSTSTFTFGDLGDKTGHYIHVGTPRNKVWVSKDKTWPELSELGENSKGVPLYQIDSKEYDARFGEPTLVDYEGNSLGIPISKGSWEEPNSIFRGFPQAIISKEQMMQVPHTKTYRNPVTGLWERELYQPEKNIFQEETPTVEWPIGRTAPQITADNAAGITPEQTALASLNSDINPKLPMAVKALKANKQAVQDIAEMNKYHAANVTEYNKATGSNSTSIPFRTDITGSQIKVLPDEEFNAAMRGKKTNSPNGNVENIGGLYSGTDDTTYLRAKGNPSTAYHEFLHRHRYGTTNPEVTKWRIDQLVDPEKIKNLSPQLKQYYLSEMEFPVHLRQQGESMGIKVGQEFPGEEAFDELLFNNGRSGAATYAKGMDLDSPIEDKKLVWKALNGTLFGQAIPIIGLGAAGTLYEKQE